MSSQKQRERKRISELITVYRKAWNHMLIEVETLQAAMNDAPHDERMLAMLRGRSEQAGSAYRDARNALAEAMLRNGRRDAGEDVLGVGCHAA